MTIMAFRDLIPWSRQENRLPVPVSAERGRDNDTHPLLSLHREVNRLFDDVFRGFGVPAFAGLRSEEHTSELQSLMRISYAVFCLKKKRYTMKHSDYTCHKSKYSSDLQ